MNNKISWTRRCEDGVKREVRVEITSGNMKWQFKRTDEGRWNYDSQPSADDWNELEDILARRMGRGRSINMQKTVRKMRAKTGV